MNTNIIETQQYQYRGCTYSKSYSYKYPINVSTYQLDKPIKPSESITLKYRGASYSKIESNYTANFGFSVYTQKYRGTDYLVCMAELHSDR